MQGRPSGAATKAAARALSWCVPRQSRLPAPPLIVGLPRRIGPRQRYVPGGVVAADLSKQITPEIIDHTPPS